MDNPGAEDSRSLEPHRAGERWPDFLLIGAPKAGSTALYRALGRHPRIFVSPEKQPNYFSLAGRRPRYAGPGAEQIAQHMVWDRQAYLRLFSPCPPGHVAGEASIGYLHDPVAPAAARAAVPSARLLAVLRQPVDRAYSQWLHLRQEGREPLGDFEEAFFAGAGRHAQGWPPLWLYRERGFYGEQIERWIAHFPRDQLLVLFYEEWLERPEDVLTRIYAHLGIEDCRQPKVTRENVSSRQPRWKWLHYRMTEDNALRAWAQRRLPLAARDAVTRVIQAMNLKPGPRLDPGLRDRLSKEYGDDITRLEALTARDLAHWKSGAEA